jgi:hypothetical protein
LRLLLALRVNVLLITGILLLLGNDLYGLLCRGFSIVGLSLLIEKLITADSAIKTDLILI